MCKNDISVIIPCLNEVGTIFQVLRSLSDELVASELNFEIIFCDNGSTDNSVNIARRFGAKIVHSKALAVAGVRNEGVRIANGALLIFIDADIVVQGNWGKRIKTIFNNIVDENIIVGSHATFPANIKPLLSSWYEAIANDGRNTHLGAGHMMLSADNFKKIGGFDESIVTGEDYDFCRRAKQSGFSIIDDHDLVVCHLGYPNSLLEFAGREVWHGEGDCKSLSSIVSSKVALTGILFLLLFSAIFPMLYVYPAVSFVFFFMTVLMSIIVQHYKFGFDSLRSSFGRSVVSYIYLLSRGVSLPRAIIKKNSSR